MTYEANLRRTTGKMEEQSVAFLLPQHVIWDAGGIRSEVTVLSPQPFMVTAGSSITLHAFCDAMKIWLEEGVSAVLSLELQARRVRLLYTFRRSEEVSQFLRAHPFLLPLLLETHRHIQEYFGSSSEVVLEVITDPEAENDRELFVLVLTSLDPDEAFGCLERFDQEWWLDASSEARRLMNVDVEYI